MIVFMEHGTTTADTTVPRHLPEKLTPLDVGRQKVRSLQSQVSRERLRHGELATRLSGFGQALSSDDQAALAKSEQAVTAVEVALDEAREDVDRLGREAARDRVAREASERLQRLSKYIEALSMSQVPAAVAAVESARSAAAQAREDHKTLTARGGELRTRADRQDQDLERAASEYAQALVRGVDPQPIPAKIDYAPTLKVLQTELAKSEERIKQADLAVQHAEHALDLAHAGDIYARIYHELQELLAVVPDHLPMPDAWSRIMAIQPNSDRVVITLAREPKL